MILSKDGVRDRNDDVILWNVGTGVKIGNIAKTRDSSELSFKSRVLFKSSILRTSDARGTSTYRTLRLMPDVTMRAIYSNNTLRRVVAPIPLSPIGSTYHVRERICIR